MNLIDLLLGEHGQLHALFDALETLAEREPAPGLLGRVLAHNLLAHSRGEEELLFPDLESHIGPQGPLAVMRSEHEHIDTLLEDLETWPRILELIEVCRRHFLKEEQVLFPLARQVLDEGRLQALGLQWAHARGLVPG